MCAFLQKQTSEHKGNSEGDDEQKCYTCESGAEGTVGEISGKIDQGDYNNYQNCCESSHKNNLPFLYYKPNLPYNIYAGVMGVNFTKNPPLSER